MVSKERVSAGKSPRPLQTPLRKGVRSVHLGITTAQRALSRGSQQLPPPSAGVSLIPPVFFLLLSAFNLTKAQKQKPRISGKSKFLHLEIVCSREKHGPTSCTFSSPTSKSGPGHHRGLLHRASRPILYRVRLLGARLPGVGLPTGKTAGAGFRDARRAALPTLGLDRWRSFVLISPGDRWTRSKETPGPVERGPPGRATAAPAVRPAAVPWGAGSCQTPQSLNPAGGQVTTATARRPERSKWK
ncbi:hypothetical protein H920_13603 [Fukomys damarensis]|uniref:Uncharacterized protein n=1 Tax=Fukomys damarensis TaxID=885580 RepID=A0A091D200_FUKDA|nr:hypothetical protein H920_13603 [Fukomys damarensis]